MAEADELDHELLKLLEPERAVPVGIKPLEHGARVSVDLELRESVLQLGGTWRSYDGTFSNYFSVGVDAAGAHAFHSARRANPARFSSPLKNQALYAWLGACATGGLCGCKGPPPKLHMDVRGGKVSVQVVKGSRRAKVNKHRHE